jgi:hypothetical protein
MEFLSLLIGITLTAMVQGLKHLGWQEVKPKTIIVIVSAIVGGIAIFLTPEQTAKIVAYATTGIASASGLYEYLKPFTHKKK